MSILITVGQGSPLITVGQGSGMSILITVGQGSRKFARVLCNAAETVQEALASPVDNGSPA
jgi:hypothetical protein